MLDTLNTNNFNSKVYNSVQDQDISAGLGNINLASEGGVFTDVGNSKILSVIQTNQSKDGTVKANDNSAVKNTGSPIQVLTPGPTLDADLP